MGPDSPKGQSKTAVDVDGKTFPSIVARLVIVVGSWLSPRTPQTPGGRLEKVMFSSVGAGTQIPSAFAKMPMAPTVFPVIVQPVTILPAPEPAESMVTPLTEDSVVPYPLKSIPPHAPGSGTPLSDVNVMGWLAEALACKPPSPDPLSST